MPWRDVSPYKAKKVSETLSVGDIPGARVSVNCRSGCAGLRTLRLFAHAR